MAFADTITITINSVGKVLNRINQDGYSSEYFLRETTGEFRLKLRNSSYARKNGRKVDRHNVELTHSIYAVSPATINTERKGYYVFENEQLDAVADNVLESVGLVAFLTNGNLTKLANYES